MSKSIRDVSSWLASRCRLWSEAEQSFATDLEEFARCIISEARAGFVASTVESERLRDLEELTRERDEARARAEAGDAANARLEARNAELEAQLSKVRELVAAFGATK